MTYFNTQYPSHQGEDTAVLSLRYDLLPAAAQCEVAAPNLILNSGDLSAFSGNGWHLAPCTSGGKCLAALPGYSLVAPSNGPWSWQEGVDSGVPDLGAFTATGVTWLSDYAQVATGGDAGVPDGGVPSTSLLTNVVYQNVTLGPGAYVLSWWDQARCPSGGFECLGSAMLQPYVAEVTDGSGVPVATFTQVPFAGNSAGDGGAAGSWSGRNAISFTVATSGTYSVAFGASTSGATNGDVAIANVQLELAPTAQPSTYVSTTSTTMVQATNCPLSDGQLRAAFTHNCDGKGNCSYDLSVPLVIDTTQLGGGTPLGSKLAGGNFNYRHLDSALNLVGTNVHSCANDPNPNCYGSAYVQYDFQHDATSAGVLGYDGNARFFDFGLASINHGKALAAERYLTEPLSSADQALIKQPGIEHIELGGRPLDGTYHLRIWDSPDLNWSALQDIQVILDYEYWSQIQANGNTGQARRLHRAPRKPIILSQPRRR